jgi:exodeoxyribonuclease VIII
MPDEEYFALSAVSQSYLKLLDKSAYHYKYSVEHPSEPTAAMELGSALHSYLLTPDNFRKNYYISEKINRARKIGKEKWERALEKAGEKKVLFKDDFKMIKDMAKQIINHPKVSQYSLLNDIKGEVVLTWDALINGISIPCKCKIDAIKTTPHKEFDVLIDLKTTKDASYLGFQRAIADYKYHLQAAFYSEAYRQNTGRNALFTFIAVENTPPYAVGIYTIDSPALSTAICEYKNLLIKYLEYKEKKFNVGLNDFNVKTIGLPQYYMYRVANL